MNKLQYVQNAAACVITRTARGERITPLLKELHWLPVYHRVQYKVWLHTYKALNNLSPSYIRDLVDVYKPSRTLRSGNSLSLVVPRTKTVTYGNRLFRKAAPVLWNALPSSLREARTVVAFKRHLKTFLFNDYYN